MREPVRDAVIVGAGFGGLAAGLRLAEAGAHVTLCEALRYPGGCASTFTRGGRRYESGATLFSGFGEGQLFARWIEAHALPVRFVPLDPVVELVAPDVHLALPGRRDALVARIAAAAHDAGPRVRAFFEEQRRVADALWALFDDESLLPPFSASTLLRHVARAPRYLPVLRVIGRPLLDVLRRHRVERVPALRTFVDAICQITVQTSAAEAEAPFALAAMDYLVRGTGHVHGGIGVLADALARVIQAKGSEVRFSNRVLRVRREGDVLRVDTRRGVLLARNVVLNLLPRDARALLGIDPGAAPRLERLEHAVSSGWGAAMLYLVVRDDDALPASPHHLELIADRDAPFVEGNHVFCSISGRDEVDRAEPGHRTVTVSTHVPGPTTGGAERMSRVQATMLETLRSRAPTVADAIVHTMTASPRTFERFVGRTGGFVGGIPRRAGLEHYLEPWPRPIAPGVWLVGDSVFPGQSTLATAISGIKVAERILARG